MADSISDIGQMIEEAISSPGSSDDSPAPHVNFTSGQIRRGDILDGTYRIDREIGRGGMGTVYEAWHIALERRQAIKVIRGVYATIPDFLKRFRMEAVTMAQVRHPNVVGIHHCEVRESGPSYLVMEFVEGETLSALLARKGHLPYAIAVDICRQILRALHAIHQKGIVHRDLKPGNIMLTPTLKGYGVHICDFGLGKMLEQSDPGHARTEMTEAGVLLGTPNYMSPEQCRGERVTVASDIYAVGIVLFEMLTGRPPFSGGTKHSTIMRHLTMAPPIDRLSDDIPKGARHVIAKALTKEIDRRYLKVVDMLRAINAIQVEKPRKKVHGGALTVALVLLIGVLGMSAYLGLGMMRARRNQDQRITAGTSMDTSIAVVKERNPAETPVPVESEGQDVVPPDTLAPLPKADIPVREWPKKPSVLLALASSYGDSGDQEAYNESLTRFLTACKSHRDKMCSSANIKFARARLKDR